MRRSITLVALLALAGCSTALTVSDISAAKPGTDLKGIPFRVKAPRTIRVWARQPSDENGKVVYQAVFVKPFELPDPRTLYALGFEADTFSSKCLEVKLNSDGSLASVRVKSENRADEVVAKVGKKVSAAADAAASYPNTVRQAETAQLKAADDLALAQAALAQTLAQPAADRETNLVAALQAYVDAEAADRSLRGLAFDATTAQRAEAAAALRLAQYKANIAYEKAGLAPPFPGVSP
jgi:hypothetical protein